MSKNFQPLSSGEVLSVNNASSFVIGHSTFRVDEFTTALKKLLLEQGLGGLTEETIDWLTDNGIECDVLRFGASGWVKGKVRLHLEFAEDEAGEASADPKPQAATDDLPSVAANEFSTPAMAMATASATDQSVLEELELEFNEADFADLTLELGGAEAQLPEIEDSETITSEQSFDDFDGLDLDFNEDEAATQAEPDDFEALFGEDSEAGDLAPESAAASAERADELEDLFGDETPEPEAVIAPESEATFAEPADDLEDLFGEEDADFDVLVAAEPDHSELDLDFAGADDLEDLFGDETNEIEALSDEPVSEAIAPGETDESSTEIADLSTTIGKETVVSQDTLVQSDEASLESLMGGEPDFSFDSPTDALDAEHLDDLLETEVTDESSEDDLEDLFGESDDTFGTDLFDGPDAELEDLELTDEAIALDLEDFVDDDEPTAITVEDDVNFDDDGTLEDLEDLFETPETNAEEDVFQSLLADDSPDSLGDSDELLGDEEANPFASSEAVSTLPDSPTIDDEEDPFAVFSDTSDTGEETLDELGEDLGLSLDTEGEEDIFADAGDLGLDDLFEETDTAEPSPSQSTNEDLGEFINVAMFRKKQ